MAEPLPQRPRAIPVEVPRRGFFRKRSNRRVLVVRRSPFVWLGESLRFVASRLAVVGKLAVVIVSVAGAGYGGRHLVRHVVSSPRFALREIRAAATPHVAHEDIVSLSGLHPGDRLLAIDTDAVAARVAAHPWVASVRVRRQLPSALAIDVIERRAAATALLGTLYLLDEAGRPFKRATLEEADGLPIITGLSREQYTLARGASEAAFREGLGLLAAYRAEDALGAARKSAGSPAGRPPLSEIHVDPRAGFSLVLYDGGGEVLLGRGDWSGKLARLDEILGALGPRGPAALRTVHLDGPSRDRVAVRLAPLAPG